MKNYRAGSILVKFFSKDGKPIINRMIKLRHFRNRNGNKFTNYGGHTVLFDLDMGIVVSSTCHPRDKFSRKAGTEFCIMRWVEIMKNDHHLRHAVGDNTPYVDSISSEMDVITVTLTHVLETHS